MQYRPGFPSLNVALCAALAGAAVSLFSGAAAAQQLTGNFPFPSTKPTMGLTTSVLTSHELRAQYELWRTRFIERCGQGDARIRYPESGNDTRSEGVGYGMVIAAYMGDQTTFDGLWDYYQRASAGTGLMNWRRDGCAAGGGGGDTGSAADADVDAAFGLIVANRQWGGYAADAGRVIAAIRTNLFQGGCQGILLAGTQFAACGCINPSYIPPGYYTAFGAADAGQANFWSTARNNSYTYFAAVSDNNTGLVPAWSQSNGSLNLQCNGTPQVSGGGATNEFQADAARTPWRVAVDYLWTGNASARTFLQDIGDFAASQPIVHIVDRYNLQGTPLNRNMQSQTLDADGFRSTFTMGGFATAMTAASQEDLDAYTGAWQSMYVPGDNVGMNLVSAPRAFNSSLALLYGLAVTGYMWDPSGANPARATEPPVVDQPGNQLENGDFDQGVLGWTFANLNDTTTPGTRAEGYAMHKAGELNIRVQRAAARTQDPWEVRLSQPVSVQTGTKYLISVRARAASPRPFKISVESGVGQAFALYGALGNRRDAMTPVSLTPEMQTFEWVFSSLGTNQNASFDVDVADSTVGLVVDDIFFGTTDRPVSVPGELSGMPPVTTTPDPTNPGQTPVGGGGGTTPPATGPGGVAIPNQDVGSTPVGAPSGGTSAPASGGLPPAPTTRVQGTGECTTDAQCNGYKCSNVVPALWLCYDPATGYVADPRSDTGWAQPPNLFDGDGDMVRDDDCGMGNVFWVLQNGCYDPDSGYAFNPSTRVWEFVGVDYQRGRRNAGAADAACAVGNGPGSRHGLPWALSSALLGAVVSFGVRRRSRAAR